MYYNNKRLALSFFWVVLGAVLVGLSVAETIESSFYSGFGGGLIAVGILQIMRNLKYRKNEEYKEKIDIAENDERLKFIRMKAWSWTGYILVIASSIGTIAGMIVGNDMIRLFCSYYTCAILVIYWVVYLILNKKY